MFELFTNIKVDWMGIRRPLIAVSIGVLLAGLLSAVGRQVTPGGTDAFNLGVDFKGGTVMVAKFNDGKPSEDDIRKALAKVGLGESVIQASTDKDDEVLIKVPLLEGEKDATSGDTEVGKEDSQSKDAAEKTSEKTESSPLEDKTGSDKKESLSKENEKDSDEKKSSTDDKQSALTQEEAKKKEKDSNNQVSKGRLLVKQALDTFGKEAAPGTLLADSKDAKYQIVGTDSVGPVAGAKLRNQAVLATLLGMGGILLFIAFRYDWTYAAGAVIAVFHDVLVTLAFFTMFQWEVSLTVLAALLTLVGFSVNDSIVIFDRIRENMSLNKKGSLYDITNNSINQTMSRTIVTNGLVFLAVLALVLFGGEVLRGFSLALFVGAISGTYSTIAIASPIAVWWQSKLGVANMRQETVNKDKKLASAARGSVRRRPVSK